MSVQTNIHIPFEKAKNFRDIGGFKTKENRRIKTGIIYRSDDLSKLSLNDLTRLENLGLQFICDLRSHNERKSKPDRLPVGSTIKTIHVPVHDETQNYTHLQFMKLLITQAKELDFSKLIKEFYLRMASERQNEVKDVLTYLASSEHTPALIHCTGGKDRTGFIVALIHLLVGVDYETAIEHYLQSNELIGPRMQKAEKFIQLMSLYRVKPNQIRPLLTVDREYLDEVFQYIFAKYGNVENYLIQGCRMDEKTLHQLKELLLE